MKKRCVKVEVFFLMILILLSGCKNKNEKLVLEIELNYCKKFYEVTEVLEDKNGYDEEIINYYTSGTAIEKIEELKEYGEYFVEQLRENNVDDIEVSQWEIHIESDLQRLADICEFSKKYKDTEMFIKYEPQREELTIEEISICNTLSLSNKNARERIEQIEQYGNTKFFEK